MYIEVDSVLPDGLDPVLKQKYEDIKNGKELSEATNDEIKAALAAVRRTACVRIETETV